MKVSEAKRILFKRKIHIDLKKKRYYFPDREYYRNYYLHSEHWCSLRKQKLIINPFCENCGSKTCLDIHHIDYKSLYNVEITDLVTLCRFCHNHLHKEERNKKREARKRLNEHSQYLKTKKELKKPKQKINFYIAYYTTIGIINILKKDYNDLYKNKFSPNRQGKRYKRIISRR